jgi:hypothetical protein
VILLTQFPVISSLGPPQLPGLFHLPELFPIKLVKQHIGHILPHGGLLALFRMSIRNHEPFRQMSILLTEGEVVAHVLGAYVG